MNWSWFEVLIASPRTSGSFRCVGAMLAIRAKRNDPTCNPSIRTLCRDASVSHDTACAAIRHFEQLGMLRVRRRRGRANIYELTVPATGTVGVPDTRTLPTTPECSSHRNTNPQSVPATGTQVFQSPDAVKEKPEPPPVQEEVHVDEIDLAEVPY